ncbi:MAG: hypothetical protein IKD18_05535 [Clostridia bacterium]|nr:hypothetical protein [Clostridia bacterium]
MKKLGFVRGVATAGNVVFSILNVFSIIAVVALIFSILFLSFLPGQSIAVETETNVAIRVDFKTILGKSWESLSEEDLKTFQSQLGEGYEMKDGVATVKEGEAVTVHNRSMALALIPAMTQMLITAFFFRYLAKACGAVKKAVYTPFVVEAAQNLKNGGISLFFLYAAPSLCGGLITLLTHEAHLLGQETDLSTVLWGFMLIALSFLFEYAAPLSPAPYAAPPQNQNNPENL